MTSHPFALTPRARCGCVYISGVPQSIEGNQEITADISFKIPGSVRFFDERIEIVANHYFSRSISIIGNATKTVKVVPDHLFIEFDSFARRIEQSFLLSLDSTKYIRHLNFEINQIASENGKEINPLDVLEFDVIKISETTYLGTVSIDKIDVPLPLYSYINLFLTLIDNTSIQVDIPLVVKEEPKIEMFNKTITFDISDSGEKIKSSLVRIISQHPLEKKLLSITHKNKPISYEMESISIPSLHYYENRISLKPRIRSFQSSLIVSTINVAYNNDMNINIPLIIMDSPMRKGVRN